MSALIEQIESHWNSIAGVESLEVPEWNTTVYWKKLNLKERDAIDKVANTKGIHHAGVQLLIMKCKDESGKPLFNIGDRNALLFKADPGVVERIVTKITGEDDTPENVRDAEGN
jgi:hypothetical protein